MSVGSVSVVVAAFNEGAGIAPVIERIVAALSQAAAPDWELIVVDDGSSDATPTALREFSASNPGVMRPIAHSRNRGLVAAMRTGAEAAINDTVAFLDADLSYEPQTVQRLVAAKRLTGAGVAVASPYMRGGRVANVPFDRLVASRGANWLLSRCAGGSMRTFTGMVRAYDRALIQELFTKPVIGEFNTWAIAATLRTGRAVVEIPAALVWPRERFEGSSRISPGKLVERAKLVVETARFLSDAYRHGVSRKTGTLVLTNEPDIPYSLLTPNGYT